MASKGWAGPLPAVKSKVDLVYDNVRAAIAEGDLEPGERINMDELARALGVSKIPIREAIKRLESEGLVVSRAHAGVVVAPIDRTEMRGVFLAREAIEGLVGRLAAERVTDAVLEDLERIQQEMRAELDRGAVDRLPELNSGFHRRLAEASGYRILGELTEQLLFTIRRYRLTLPAGEQNWHSVADEHDTIIQALRRKDADAVAVAARAHIISQAGQEVAERP
ncbi:GntR family transcriptional regulator [Actinoallomurus iriomotensis]|uniref:GntR family transcriptional regulator n=1 Tax=Actinoallomurus iriomotensis TaxID=478107 RepID=A0A9W6W218_9ACTN|nr:GntR family transcriptional regulator [Actinoallomurus iriomotensis]GLY87984.1 GntR family transcriptional regulator [Actinoallomurus iriomotensis]